MAAELFAFLLRSTCALSAALGVVLLVRRFACRRAGPAIAYQLWLLVPVALIAIALPPLSAGTPSVMLVAQAFKAPALSAAQLASRDWTPLALLVWACGAAVVGAGFIHTQRQFVRGLGVLADHGSFMVAEHAIAGPVLLGLWRARIVVPADFAVRYTARQQALIIAHEQTHAQRGDPSANLLAAILQMVFWFNPLMVLATTRFRLDQEMACDARVIDRFPEDRQTYAAALLQTQVSAQSALTTCHWQSTHPLKDRILQLQQRSPSLARRRTSRLLLASMVCAAAATALAARADSVTPQRAQYRVSLSLKSAAGEAAPKVLVRGGEPFTLRTDLAGAIWELVVTVKSAGDDKVMLGAMVSKDGRVLSKPAVLAALGQATSVQSSGDAADAFSLAIKVEPAGSAVK